MALFLSPQNFVGLKNALDDLAMGQNKQAVAEFIVGYLANKYVLTGTQFWSLFDPSVVKMKKTIRSSMISRGLSLKPGFVVDCLPFNPTPGYYGGGIHFALDIHIHRWLDYETYDDLIYMADVGHAPTSLIFPMADGCRTETLRFKSSGLYLGEFRNWITTPELLNAIPLDRLVSWVNCRTDIDHTKCKLGKCYSDKCKMYRTVQRRIKELKK